jgi:hypothetical protein
MRREEKGRGGKRREEQGKRERGQEEKRGGARILELEE